MLLKTKYHAPSLVAALMLTASLCVCLSGCSTLSPLTGKAVPADSQTSVPTETFTVEMRGLMQQPKIYEGMLDGPITVQTVLEEFGAIKKFRNMEITILRVVKESGRGLKMPIKYNPRDRAVTPEQDYAILPNDRIVIEPSSNSTLAKMVNSLNSK
jgi:hypothetical protein